MKQEFYKEKLELYQKNRSLKNFHNKENFF